MRSNPIDTLMATCTGSNLAVENGRKACGIWMWIEPPCPLSRKLKGLVGKKVAIS
jgi:hypothetical protein